MDWEQIVGQEELKVLLQQSIDANRVGHAQLFTGKSGYGTLALAMAFAKEVLERENPAAAGRVASLNHIDLHFTFPVYKTKDKGFSQPFQEDFRNLILQNPYADSTDWSALLNSQNKQLSIYADEIDALTAKFMLKSYEGGSKILIMWQADRMNPSAANKFLKFLEEPPEKTLVLLLAEDTSTMLPTILSRTQEVQVKRLSDEAVRLALQNTAALPEEKINEIVFQAQGDWNAALKLYTNAENSSEFETFFVQWVREAFQVKKKPEFLKNIVLWARTVASWNREKQKSFLAYCAEMFRLAMLQNYGTPDLVYKNIQTPGFKWESFSKFIHGANIEAILEELSEADYHLERNGNANIVWTDMGIKLSRYLHRKATA